MGESIHLVSITVIESDMTNTKYVIMKTGGRDAGSSGDFDRVLQSRKSPDRF